MVEIWKNIKGFKDYQVSNLGRVKSFKSGEWNILKLSGGNGYKKVSIMSNNKAKTKRIHVLVAEAFLNHIPDGLKLVVDHKNNIKHDNRVENLQIITQRLNVSKKNGDYSSKYTGVCWDKRRKKWVSLIHINGKLKYLGTFSIEKEASIAYQNALSDIVP